jgi:hypothetical protein
LQSVVDAFTREKDSINKNFYSKYYRFIQEGTWIDESYIDDNQYYIDAQSVLYNSCYPAVSYTINVLELSQLEGYENFKFTLGETTYAYDQDFLEEGKIEVVITETSEKLDSPE